MRMIDADALIDSLGIEDEDIVFREMLEEAPTVGGWISIKDRLPESGKHVLLSCDIGLLSGRRKQYTCVGFYSKAHTLSEGSYPEDDEAYDYDEEEDVYYLKEGWYEAIHNWGEYSSVVIEDFVTHWMPLPEPPKEVPNGNEH